MASPKSDMTTFRDLESQDHKGDHPETEHEDCENQEEGEEDGVVTTPVSSDATVTVSSPKPSPSSDSKWMAHFETTLTGTYHQTKDMTTSSRAQREPAIERGRQRTRYNQLIEQYHIQNNVLQGVIQLMSRKLLEQPPDYKGLKADKKCLEGGMRELVCLLGEIRNIQPNQEIEDNFPTLDYDVSSLVNQYRLLFPKTSPSAPSSTLTGSTVSQHSRKTANDARELVKQKEAVAKQGERAAQLLEEDIAALYQKMRDEQEEFDKAKDDVRRKAEEAKEEARRKAEAAKEEARRYEEEARKRAEEVERLEQKRAELDRQELEKEARKRQEQTHALIEQRRREKEKVVRMYKDKEWDIITQTLIGPEPTTTKPELLTNVPKFSMIDAYMDETKLKPIKIEGMNGAAITRPSLPPPRYTQHQSVVQPANVTATTTTTTTLTTPIGLRQQYGTYYYRKPSPSSQPATDRIPSTMGYGGGPFIYTSANTTATTAISTSLMSTLHAGQSATAVATMTPTAMVTDLLGDYYPSSSAAPVLVSQSTLRPYALPFPNPNYHMESGGHYHTAASTPITDAGNQATSFASQEALTRTLADAVMQTRLPVAEPTVFNGDPLIYPSWRSAFQLLIQRQNISDEEKLIYLQRYVGGAAKEAISGFFLLRSPAALEEALATLEQRFGNAFVVARAFREKLDAWPTIKNKDGEGLRKLADFAKQTLVASRVVGQLKILDDAQYQRNLLDRLPEWLTRKWVQIVTETKEKHLRYPTFQELADFLSRQANMQCEPIFGSGRPQGQTAPNTKSILNTDATPKFTAKEVDALKAMLKKEEGPRGTSNVTQSAASTGSAMQSSPATTRRQCIFCKGTNHRLLDCKKLEGKTVKERKDFFIKERLCFACGIPKHLAKECRNRATCKTCKGKHPTILHQSNKPVSTRVSEIDVTISQKEAAASEPKNKDSSSTTTGVGAVTSTCSFPCSLSRTTMIIPVFVSSSDDPATEVKTYALLDTMSFLTFISETVSDQLQAEQVDTTLSLNTMTSNNQLVHSKAIKGLRVRPVDSDQYLNLPLSYTTNNLSVNTETIPTPEIAQKYSHLKRIASQLHPPQEDCTAGLLIGYDCAEALMPIEVIPGNPYAVRTMLGWSIVGEGPSSYTADCLTTSPAVVEVSTIPMVDTQTSERNGTKERSLTPINVAHVFRTHAREATTTEVLRLMERDFIETESGRKSQDDMRFLKIMEDNIKVNTEGHYEMPLPFKHGDPPMPDNKLSAMNRALILKKQLEKNPVKKKHYIDFMNDILSEGHAERVPASKIDSTSRWYIPHHGVYNEKKPNKIRVVFDCSAKFRGVSINDHLLQGPDLINSLIGVLCRFRKGKIAFSCDVQKMYHQFHVTPHHRDYLRFLWWEGGDITGPLIDYRMKVHVFGATSSPGCANYGLKQLATDHENEHRQAADFLRSDFYVDDGLHAEDEVETAVETLKGAIHICTQGKMRLHKIVSNSAEFLSHFPASECSSSREQDIGFNDCTPVVERTLGLQWCVNQDTFTFSHDVKVKPITRRGMLSTIASLYDPLGFIAPIVLQGKVLLQQVCRSSAEWDDPLTADIESEWLQWTESQTSTSCTYSPQLCSPALQENTGGRVTPLLRCKRARIWSVLVSPTYRR